MVHPSELIEIGVSLSISMVVAWGSMYRPAGENARDRKDPISWGLTGGHPGRCNVLDLRCLVDTNLRLSEKLHTLCITTLFTLSLAAVLVQMALPTFGAWRLHALFGPP